MICAIINLICAPVTLPHLYQNHLNLFIHDGFHGRAHLSSQSNISALLLVTFTHAIWSVFVFFHLQFVVWNLPSHLPCDQFSHLRRILQVHRDFAVQFERKHPPNKLASNVELRQGAYRKEGHSRFDILDSIPPSKTIAGILKHTNARKQYGTLHTHKQ